MVIAQMAFPWVCKSSIVEDFGTRSKRARDGRPTRGLSATEQAFLQGNSKGQEHVDSFHTVGGSL